jgi:hypothetical protein
VCRLTVVGGRHSIMACAAVSQRRVYGGCRCELIKAFAGQRMPGKGSTEWDSQRLRLFSLFCARCVAANLQTKGLLSTACAEQLHALATSVHSMCAALPTAPAPKTVWQRI